MDILESKIKEVLDEKYKIQSNYKELADEVASLRDTMKKLELERDDIRSKVDRIIERVELYLNRSEL